MCQVRSQNINTRYTFMHPAPKKVHTVNEKRERTAQKSTENPPFRLGNPCLRKGVYVQAFNVK